MALGAAVPLWIEQLRRVRLVELQRRAPELAEVIAAKGDIIQFRSKKKGETAAAFNALAEAVAIGAFVPGGITVFGQHFEARHPDRDDPEQVERGTLTTAAREELAARVIEDEWG